MLFPPYLALLTQILVWRTRTRTKSVDVYCDESTSFTNDEGTKKLNSDALSVNNHGVDEPVKERSKR